MSLPPQARDELPELVNKTQESRSPDLPKHPPAARVCICLEGNGRNDQQRQNAKNKIRGVTIGIPANCHVAPT
jgi:hypothetical protein